ncbi:MAG: hypothetical protein QME62_07355 [Armatimonadota bacterium]|nr:hypothetical protein [Armatimonadota bacterium]
MKNEVILIRQAGLGHGDPQLGNLLLANFLQLLCERHGLPKYLILLNEGVTLTQEGSNVIEYLTKLSECGVKILACQTSVEYFALEDKISVGEIANMQQIQDILFSHEVLTI